MRNAVGNSESNTSESDASETGIAETGTAETGTAETDSPAKTKESSSAEPTPHAPAPAPLLVARLERLRWRSRRGLLELELLLAPYLEHLAQQPEERLLDQYEALLEFDDLDLHEWLMARSEPLPEAQPVIREMRTFLSRRQG